MPTTQIQFDSVSKPISTAQAFKFWRSDKNTVEQAAQLAAYVGFIVTAGVILSILMLADGNGVSSLIVIFILGSFVLAVMMFIFLGEQKAVMRARAFAQDNNFYFEQSVSTTRAGLLFERGDSKRAINQVSGIYKDRNFACFNYSFIEGSGKNKKTYNYGVTTLTLDRRVPHVLFDSRRNNGWGSNIASLHGSQKLKVEGDFNRYFDIYVPAGYGRDALYFLTPELMAVMIDHATKYDIEVIDNVLYFFSDEFAYTRNELEVLFKLIENVGGEFHDNTDRYADARVGNRSLNQVAQGGQRLKKGLPISLIATAFVVVLYLIIELLSA